MFGQTVTISADIDGDHYVLNGAKTFISNGQISEDLAVQGDFGGGQALSATGLALAALVGGALLGLVVAVWLESIAGRRELVFVAKPEVALPERWRLLKNKTAGNVRYMLAGLAA